MVRKIVFALSLVACGGPSNNAEMNVTTDLTMVPDLSLQRDLTMRKKNCSQTLMCVSNAGSNTTAILACQDMASTTALALIETMNNCILAACSPTRDAGMGDGGLLSCSGPSDVSAGCQMCVQTAVSPGGGCNDEASACVNDPSH